MDAVIPSGPLHPEDAVAALLVGLAVGLVARFSTAGPLLVVAAAGVTFEHRHGGLWDAVVDRPAPVWALLGVVSTAIVVAALAAPLGDRSMRLAGLVATLPVLAVWGLVADTEAPLIGGLVLAGSLVFGPGRAGPGVAAMALVGPVAALVGSVGRPGQLTLALVATVAWAFAVRVALVIAATWRGRRQRAGTPTTVEPGSTSSTTTAPAATTAP
ncbi:MAG: hypothetical protein AAGE98_02215 [Actinomycetota bacterium]